MWAVMQSWDAAKLGLSVKLLKRGVNSGALGGKNFQNDTPFSIEIAKRIPDFEPHPNRIYYYKYQKRRDLAKNNANHFH